MKNKLSIITISAILLSLLAVIFMRSESELEKNLKLLKDGNTKPLTGFALGDKFDSELAYETDEYFSGGQISKLKSGKYIDTYLIFDEAKQLKALGAETTGNFLGIALGETTFQNVKDILGSPDVYEEKSDMYDLPFALYNFEKNTLYMHMDNEDRVWQILYKTKE